jgi:hypothetical protein
VSSYYFVGSATAETIGYPTVTHGSQLNASNTGIPTGRSLTNRSSDLDVTESWITNSNGGLRYVEDINFLSGYGIHIQVSNFTTKYCRWNGLGTNGRYGSPAVDKNTGLTGLAFEWCEFDGNHEATHGGDFPFYDMAEVSLLRCHIHRWPRCIPIGSLDPDPSNTSVTECYMHDLTRAISDGAHLENIYVAGGTGISLVRSKVIANLINLGGNGAASASLAIYNESYATFTPLEDIVIQDNYFDGDGSYSGYFGAISAKGNPFPINIDVTGNIFGREYHRLSGVYGPVTSSNTGGAGNSWSGNKWGERGPYWQAGDPEEDAAIADPGPS